MSKQDQDWHEIARNTYRRARLLLSEAGVPSSLREDFFVDELQEALFDLKEAFIANDERAAYRHIDEIHLVIRELKRIWSGGEENP